MCVVCRWPEEAVDREGRREWSAGGQNSVQINSLRLQLYPGRHVQRLHGVNRARAGLRTSGEKLAHGVRIRLARF